MGDSGQEASPLTSGGLSPPPGDVEVVGVAPEGAQLIASGLSTEVVETILQSRAPSTRKLYALKWELFTSRCGGANSTQSGLTGLTLDYRAPLGGQSVGRHPLVTHFLHNAAGLAV